MENVSVIIGQTIRKCRQNKKLSQAELAERISKSKSTLSKYESGEISVDVETLFEIAEALEVSLSFFSEAVMQRQEREHFADEIRGIPHFFRRKMAYMYFFDGRNGSVNRSVLTIGAPLEEKSGYYRATLYMNVKSYEEYYFCENSYSGHIEFHQVLTGLYMVHQGTDLEHLQIVIPENFADTDRKWGAFSGVSFRPVEPAMTKVLFTKEPLKLTPELIQELKFNKADFKHMRDTNFFTVSQPF